MSYFKDKLAFIVGGSEGIGFETARELVKSGAKVIIISRSNGKLENAQQELLKLRAGPAQTVASQSLDITDYDKTQSVLNALMKDYGVPDFLINSAGMARPGYLNELQIEYFQKMMDINYFGIVNVCKAVVPQMMTRMSGHIINVSSIAGFVGLFGYTGYCASKYAVVGFSEALMRELKPYNVDISVLCPPNTRTPGLAEENKYKPAEVLKTEEKAKPVDPDFVARELLKALPKKRFMIVPTFDGTMAYYLSRYVPSLLNQFVKRPE